MKIGTSDISAAYLGGDSVSKIYMGTVQVYESTPPTPSYAQQYLTIEALENGQIIFNKDGSKTLTYRINGGNWIDGTNFNSETINVNANDKVEFKAENLYYYTNLKNTTTQFKISGNVYSLMYGDDFINRLPDQDTDANFKYNGFLQSCTGLVDAENYSLHATTLTNREVYQNLFKNCTSLITAPAILPATTLSIKCYANMFEGCTSLTSAPKLPATTLNAGCYVAMFSGCTSLTSAPILSATSLVENCYLQMFAGCTSLTSAPELPASVLANNCYYMMFNGCTNLNYVKCLATDISASACCNNWLNGAAASGTFVKAAGMTGWQIGQQYGIPSGWTVVDAS